MASMWKFDPKTRRCIDMGGEFAPPLEAVCNERASANHDAQHGKPGDWTPIAPAWNAVRLMPTKPLTDAGIAKWRKRGYRFDADSGGILTRTESAKKELKAIGGAK